MKRLHCIPVTLLALLALLLPQTARSADEEADDAVVMSVEGELVDFLRDVKPILDAKCLSCHGPEEAKNDFRVDDHDVMFDYLEPGDLESTSLWADYLVTDDEDMRMPPPGADEVEPLTGAELATLRLWIEEGARWEEDSAEAAEEEPAAAPKTDVEKWWTLQGLFHPASVHFPIALLVVSTGFVVLSFLNRESFEPVAFHCLWIGALSAVASCVMGWSYAQSEGYGNFSFDLQNSSIDRHRWLGIAVAVLALVLIPMARSVRRTGDTGMRLMWMFGSFIMLGAVSITGYQGGELTYGEDHYLNEYNRLFPSASDVDSADQADVDSEDATLVDEPDQEAGEMAESSAETEVGTDEAAVDLPDAAKETETGDTSDDEATKEEASEEEVVEESGKEEAAEEETGDAPAEAKQDETEPEKAGSDTAAGDTTAEEASENKADPPKSADGDQ